eukprot:TRINITY_DN15236_c0_g1_i1.p1 TRINITY_DN15236_c0_g1~~TRINITY_DN15236_c0_g1_i1.p1  ORF type:complete len:393 (+),score=88.32 TRINITY_DN15236_c0_g1_i1:550-1728(+)
MYRQLLQRKNGSNCLTQIRKDLDRTFPSHPLFASSAFKEKGQAALENILAAYSLYSSSTGYCQGMNFIVGFLLIVSGFREEEVFWVLVLLMKHKIPGDLLQVEGLEGLYNEGFPLAEVLQTLCMQTLERVLPSVRRHLQSVEIPETLWLHKWHSTLFLHSFPLSHCLRIWDYIMGNGTSGIIKVTVAVLKQLKEKLANTDFGECSDCLRGVKEGLGLSSPDKLISTAEKITVNWVEIEKSRRELAREIEKRISMQENKRPAHDIIDDSLSAQSYISNHADQGNVLLINSSKGNAEGKCIFVKTQAKILSPEEHAGVQGLNRLGGEKEGEERGDLAKEAGGGKSGLWLFKGESEVSEVKQESVAQFARRLEQSSVLQSIYEREQSEQGRQIPY